MTEDASTESDETSGTFSVKARWIALFVLLIVTVGGTLGYWQYRIYYPNTDNAYVGSDIVRIAPEVSGPVIRVYVVNDGTVKTGDPLFDIDPTLYDAGLRAAQAQFDAAADASGTAADDLKKAAQTLNDKRKALDTALAAYQKALDANPSNPKAVSDAEKGWQDALKAYNSAEISFETAEDANLAVTTPTVKLRAAAAQLHKAMHDLVKTHVIAPQSGSASDVSLQAGTTVGAGHPVFAIIEGDRWWVDANFKETEIARIHPGQKAEINVDMYPGVTFNGQVESISAGSGATFSVLPPENATGNWVKVTQRFPVRISITDASDHPNKPLRVGASATVTVNTTQKGNTDSGQGTE